MRRARGHAGLAAQARHALGVTTDVHSLGDVPLPLVHAALGVAACALAFLVRVPAMGMPGGAIASGAIAAGTGAGLLLYDRLVYGVALRPGVDGTVLPVAAVAGFAIVLAASTSLWLRLGAALIAALVIGGIPHLDQLEIAGRRPATMHIVRDLAGVVVAVPFLLAGVAADDSLPLWVRAPMAAGGLTMVAFDGLRLDAVGRRPAAAAAVACGIAAALTAVLAQGGPGVRAAMVLVVWYGVRGLGHSFVAGRRGVVLILEYIAFVVLALLALAWVAAGR